MAEFNPIFLEIVQSRPLTRHKKMFGGAGGWAKDQMFVAQDSQGAIYLRFDEGDRREFSRVPGTGPFMNFKEYLRIPDTVLNDPVELDEWVERAYRYALSLPPRRKKK